MRIYFAAPYTNLAKPVEGSEYGWVPDDYTKWLRKVIEGLEDMGHEVHCPHRDDHKWGKSFPKLHELVPNQFKKITKETDLFLAYLGQPQSAGVAIEIGYAISRGTRTIIIKKPGDKITLIAQGLDEITPCEILEFRDLEGLLSQLRTRIGSQ